MLTEFVQQILGAYSNDVLVFVTAVLAGLTAFYAIQTKKSVEVLERTANMEFFPRIKGHMHMIGPVNLDLRISNVGKGSASDVVVNLSFIGRNAVERTWIQSLLTPNQFQDFFIPVSDDETESSVPYFENNETRIEISATYHDVLGESHSIREEIDVSDFVRQFRRTLSVYDEGTIEKASRNIQTISEETRNITRKISSIGDILSDRAHRDMVEFRFRNIYHRLNELNVRFDTNTELGILIRAFETELMTYRRNDLLREILMRVNQINADVHTQIIEQFDEFTDI